MFSRSDLQGLPEPTNWDGYLGEPALQALLRVKENPANQLAATSVQAASAAQWSNEEILTVNALEAMWAAGGEVVTRDGRLVQNEDTSAVEFDDGALDGLRKLARAYNDREISLLDESAPNGSRSTDAFKAGRALYMRNWPVANDVLRDLSSGSTMPFRVAGMKWDSVLGGQNLAIAESTDQPRAAQAFIEFMASPASQLLLFEVGGFAPVRTETYSVASSVSRSYAQELRTAVEQARHRPVTPCYIRFSEEFHNGIARALNNNGNLEPDLPRILSSAAKCQ
jgi:multiple sugar transport system substrate-binding protein